MQTFLKAIAAIAMLIAPTLHAIAQDSVSVTFRYNASSSVVRVMLPGDFNNFGPNNDGVISPSAASLMNYDPINDYWFKTVRLELDGGSSTNNGENGYRYKFHEHLNSSGTQYNWVADPLNPDVAVEGFGDSWVEITSPMIFQMEPANSSVFQQEFPVLAATVAALDSDSIDQAASEIFINDLLVANFEMLNRYIADIPPRIETLLHYVERPLTLVYPNVKMLPEYLIHHDGTVAIRIARKKEVIDMIRLLNQPIISSSANPNGASYAKSYYEIDEELKKQIDYIFYPSHEFELEFNQPSVIASFDENGELDFLRT